MAGEAESALSPSSTGRGFKTFLAGGGIWMWLSIVAAILVVLPIAALAYLATGKTGSDTSESWAHIAAYVLPQAVSDTALLLLGVGAITALVGTASAWLVSAYDFPGRKIVDWALLLPLAVPTYIVAYAYLDLLHPVGPVQSALRYVLNISSPQGLRLPDVRSMWGCIILLGFVLYPYVYLTARALFLMQSANLLEAARTLGASRASTFFRVALPLARPAIAVGVSLVLMETINDIGASEFLGVRTMTVSIYTTWVTRSDLAGAAQIALCMLVGVVALIMLEAWSRRRLAYVAAAQRPRRMQAQRLGTAAGWSMCVLASLPVLIGFGLPVLYLLSAAAQRIAFAGIPLSLLQATLNTFLASAAAALIAVVLGLVLAYFVRLSPGPTSRSAARLASLGYAVPGTVLAIGLLAPMAAVDHVLNAITETLFDVTVGLVVLGSGAALIYAYVARFLAIPTGSLAAGFSRISPSLDHAGRTLGRNAMGVLTQIHLPLVRPAMAAAAILVFVDCMKELPATLLLRPLNFETLATLLYGEAARGTYEDGAVAALLIIIVGVGPVIFLARKSQIFQAET